MRRSGPGRAIVPVLLLAGGIAIEARADEPVCSTDCPAEMALVGSTCIDRHEAHLVVVDADGRATRHPHHDRPPSGVRYEARSEPDVFPQAYISRNESERACNAAGKRLCSLKEWRRACWGTTLHTYPYGTTERPGACNVGKTHLLGRFFGHDPMRWKFEEHFNSPLLNREPGFLARTGEHVDCRTEDGVFDLVGNLHEWVSGTVGSELVDRFTREDIKRMKQPWRKGNGLFLGGFFSTNSEHGSGCKFVTFAHEPSYHDYSTGFRCCRDPGPQPPAVTSTQGVPSAGPSPQAEPHRGPSSRAPKPRAMKAAAKAPHQTTGRTTTPSKASKAPKTTKATTEPRRPRATRPRKSSSR